MKKTIYTLLLVAFLTGNGFAQSKLKVGFNGGLTYSSFRGNPQIETLDAGVDFLVGVSFEYQLKDRLSLVANINYDRKTATDNPYLEIIENPDDPGFYGRVKIKFQNQFISLPILVKYKFGTNDSFYVNGGPFLSYMFKSELSNDYDNVTSDETDNYKTLDFGLTIGLGKTFKLKNGNGISVEIRENLGLSDISDVPIVGDGSIKTNSLNLICNYSFDLK
ncbi:PorT family protein [Flavobacterium sp. IMCC34852]|uniref:PorT family protein n=1 Tax=Flavobacterium rivulicola TaxID=2732161 RepID=A0A7Y3RBI5_9FLAO|nr:porin family protein [Flavobacterium sp. IMCC34852]NNT72892.1 PorT family protein [Flavobacterium sp. IMCC34852]